MNTRFTVRATTALIAGALLAIAAPLAASAHVHVDPDKVAAGSSALLQFSVPNESATAKTNKITLTIPKETPFPYVSYVAVPGWTAVLTKSKLATPIKGYSSDITEAVTTVTWTANAGAEISNGQLGMFPLQVGIVPNTGSIVLKVDQSYTDGTVVSWSETGANVKKPAPVLFVNDAAPAEAGMGAKVHVSGHSGVDPVAASSDVLARALGVGGLVLGVIALIVAVARRPKSAE
jgi:uncharacterized protein YcnI